MTRLSPMLATPGTTSHVVGPDWSHEFKWDGIRVLVVVADDGHRVVTRNGNEVSVAWPELDGLGAALPPGTVVDGEVVVLDDDLRPDFGRMAARMHVRNPARIASLRGTHPGQLMVFDVLCVAGTWTLDTPLEERRAIVGDLVGTGSAWTVPPTVDDLDMILAVVDERGLEGIVSKRRGSPYRPGVRSRDWRKLRRVREMDAVVVGWRGVDGSDRGPVGSLALARWDPEVRDWSALGSVGSGLTAAEGRRLHARFRDPGVVDGGLARLVPAGFRPVPPEVVVRVRYLEATSQGNLRHPVYLGQRHDVEARSVVDGP